MSRQIDLTGQQFGDLKVIKYIGDRQWECECTCGKTVIMSSYGIRKNKEHKCTHSTYRDVDITGMKFNEWTVLGYAGNKLWRCKCSCGEERLLSKIDITGNRWKSCGHNTNNKFIDIKDKTFGSLTAVEYIGNGIWKCRCSCGEIIETHGTNLRSGRVKSCNKPIHRVENIKGQVFGSWTVLEYAGNMKWRCKCACGTERDIFGHALRSGTTKSCGCRSQENLKNTLIERYNEVNPNKVANPRETWQIDVVSSKGNLSQYIKDTNIQLGRKISTNELQNNLNLAKSVMLNYIHKYGLEDIVDLNVKQSSGELELLDFIKSIYSGEIQTNNRNILKGKELDIYIPEHRLAIEFNGSYWHNSDLKDKKYHQQKTLDCIAQGINIIHIFQYEWENEATRNKLKQLITRKLDSENNIVIGARRTKVANIANNEAMEFYYKYHISNGIAGEVNLALLYNNEIVGVMTLGKNRFSSDDSWEIYRLAYKDRMIVTGGLSKLLNQFIKQYKPNKIITYIDLSKFCGDGYIAAGFKKDIRPITSPGYVWKHQYKDVVLSRYQTTKSKLLNNKWGTADQTEDEIMKSKGFMKIYNCGNLRLVFET